MRGATRRKLRNFGLVQISTHTPHAGRDPLDTFIFCLAMRFQLTRPMRGATGASEEDFAEAIDFNSHAPCGARRVGCRICTHFTDFNSHAPCGARQSSYSLIQGITYFNSHAPCGARLDAGGPHGPPAIFQLTRPMRGATVRERICWILRRISTHTPHAGRDPAGGTQYPPAKDFNSHAPCGARRIVADSVQNVSRFQLTRPMRGATK